MVSLSLCMIMRNEATSLEKCLGSVQDIVDEIIIVDTGSTDSSLHIAKRFGAKVFCQKFINFSSARNFSLSQAKSDWILILDADEFLEPSSKKKIRDLISRKKQTHFAVWRMNFFFNGGLNVTPITRLIKNDQGFLYKKNYGESLNYSIMEKEKISCLKDESDIFIYHTGYCSDESYSVEKVKMGLSFTSKNIEDENPTAADFFYHALLQLQLSDFSSAYEVLNNAVLRFPKDSGIWFLRGCLRFSQKRYVEGEHDFLSSLSIHKKNYNTLCMLARLYQESGELAKAESLYKKIIRHQPILPHPYINIGLLFYTHGNYQKAMEYFKMVSNHPAIRQWAFIQEKLSQKRESKLPVVYQEFMDELDPAFKGVYYHIAQCSLKEGDFSAAEDWIKRELELRPHHKESLSLLESLSAYTV